MQPSKQETSGLCWEDKTFDIIPRWTVEPDLENIKSTLQSFWPSKLVRVTFFAQGAFNKLYQVEVQGQPNLVLRISLPVDPRYKTLSEIATIRWVSAMTTIPVPQIIDYDASRNSAVGFEWILMTKLDGTRLSDAWTGLEFSAKSEIVRQVASFSASLFQNRLSGVGNIYDPSTPGPPTGRIVSMAFFWGQRIHHDTHRGPFRSSREWLAARLSLSESDCQLVLDKYPEGTELESDAEDELEDAIRTLDIANRLRRLLGRVFPDDAHIEDPEPTMLCHADMSRSNILVDDTGKVTGVVDWECVSALPLWKACSYPSFLQGRPRREKPVLSRYQDDEAQKPSKRYREHLLEYELTRLRGLFLAEMERVEPRWMEVFNASQVQRDFDLATDNCDIEGLAPDILEWLGNIEGGVGGIRSLEEMVGDS